MFFEIRARFERLFSETKTLIIEDGVVYWKNIGILKAGRDITVVTGYEQRSGLQTSCAPMTRLSKDQDECGTSKQTLRAIWKKELIENVTPDSQSKCCVLSEATTRQVELDIKRSFTNIADVTLKKEYQNLLQQLILNVLRKNTYFSYYQGYHDVASIFILLFTDIEKHEHDSSLAVELENSFLNENDFLNINLQTTFYSKIEHTDWASIFLQLDKQPKEICDMPNSINQYSTLKNYKLGLFENLKVNLSALEKVMKKEFELNEKVHCASSKSLASISVSNTIKFSIVVGVGALLIGYISSTE
ncbi:hypothetical protein ACO0QE_003059 [Hanseniaspora vineae]